MEMTFFFHPITENWLSVTTQIHHDCSYSYSYSYYGAEMPWCTS